VFLLTCVLYGGFDFLYWLSTLSIIPRHSEWWPAQLSFELQYSNFFTLVLWVQQHTLAALIILYALLFTARSRNLVAQTLAGIFFLSALFSSVFVSIGAAQLALWWYVRHSWFSFGTLITALTFLLFSIPLWWIYLGKFAGVGFQPFGELSSFWLERKPLAFLVFALILCLEFMPILASAWIAVLRQRRTDSIIMLALSPLGLVSTFFIAFTVGNNYPMRASIIPIFTLIYLATPVLSEWIDVLRLVSARTVALRALLAAYFLGGILEYSSFSRYALIGLKNSSTDFNADVLRFNQGDSTVSGADLAKRADVNSLNWYLLEQARPTKPNISMDDIAGMGRDSRYRVSISTISTSRAHSHRSS
jgi:hypothetical protein